MTSLNRKASTSLSHAEREGSARQGYCASAFLAQAKDIPAVVSKVLPDGEFCTVQDLIKGVKRVEDQLLSMNPTKGLCLVMASVKDARSLTLSLVLADTSVGLSNEFDLSTVLQQQHTSLKSTVHRLEKLVADVQNVAPSYESFREQIEALPDQADVFTLLSVLEKNPVEVQSTVGPIGFNVGKIKVRELASARTHALTGRVSGGYDEQAGTVLFEVGGLEDADAQLFGFGARIRLQVVQETHRVSLLLAQLAKVPLRVEVKVPRISIFHRSQPKAGLLCDLLRVEVLEQAGSLESIKEVLVRQLNLAV